MSTVYATQSGLSTFVFEASHVLDVELHPGMVRFALDVVLAPDHPQYAEPEAGAEFCFRRGRVEFTGVRHVAWTGQQARRARAVTGELDYGSIDSFTHDDLGWRLVGHWGRMILQGGRVEVVLD